MDDRATLLLVGDSSPAEFAAAIERMRASCDVVELPEPAAALRWCQRAESPPALVVIASARPGQWGDDAVEALRRRLPLTPVVALLGAWCEGEMRSGMPWPGVVRVYWHQGPQRFPQELARIVSGECAGWSLPATASAEERLLWQAERAPPGGRGVVAVVAERREMAEWLVAACRGRGWATVWNAAWRSAETRGADVVLWDAGWIDWETLEVLAKIRDVYGAPVIAITDFPRLDDQRRLTAAGAAAVFSKPLLLSDFDWQLAQLACAG